MRAILLVAMTSVILSADALKPAITPELQQEYAAAVDAAQLAHLEAEHAEKQLAKYRTGKVLGAVVAKAQVVCSLELDAAGKLACKAEPAKPAPAKPAK